MTCCVHQMMRYDTHHSQLKIEESGFRFARQGCGICRYRDFGKVGVSIQSFMLHHHGRVGTLLKSPDAKEKVLCTSMVTERDFEVEFVLTILLREFICPYSLPLSSLTHLNISCVLRFPLPLLGVHPPISSAQTLPLFAH